MTNERKIITWEQYIDVEDRLGGWDSFPDAPKHTDEENYQLRVLLKATEEIRDELKARIKELETTIENLKPRPEPDWVKALFSEDEEAKQ